MSQNSPWHGGASVPLAISVVIRTTTSGTLAPPCNFKTRSKSVFGKCDCVPFCSHRRESVDAGRRFGDFHRLTSVATATFKTRSKGNKPKTRNARHAGSNSHYDAGDGFSAVRCTAFSRNHAVEINDTPHLNPLPQGERKQTARAKTSHRSVNATDALAVQNSLSPCGRGQGEGCFQLHGYGLGRNSD